VVASGGRGIIATVVGKGRTHDFKVFKYSKTRLHPDILAMTDTGFIGIAKLHANSILPLKRSKKRPLSPKDKLFNRNVARLRVCNEHVIRSVKIFKILSERYRNRRRRFGLRVNLISAIFNRIGGF
jgi:hypothetical protein